MKFEDLTPTSHPDLFVGSDARLVHRIVGQLQRSAMYPLTLTNNVVLKVYKGAPLVHINVLDVPVGTTSTGLTMTDITKFMSDASGYIQVATFAVQLLDALLSIFDSTSNDIATIEQQLQAALIEVGANDYLDKLRDIDAMRGNATTVTQLLAELGNEQLQGPPNDWYTGQLQEADLQLHTDINTLLDTSEAYFRRTYVESLIAGDGNWMQVIPDRPVDQNGTTFDYAVTFPTVMLLISVRLAMMKFTVPAFVSNGTFSAEIDNWWRRIQQLSDETGYYVRSIPLSYNAIQLQCARANSNPGFGGEWQQHLTRSPPLSVCPVGAVDITTGFGSNSIDWQFTQFNEWYFSQGDLHGGNAGYWPPCVGPQWYNPPLNATGLPPMNDATIQNYYNMVDVAGKEAVAQVQQQIGVGAASVFAWQMFNFAYPGAPPYV